MKLIVNRRILIIEPTSDSMLIAEMLYSIISKKCSTYKIIKRGRHTNFVVDKEFYIREKRDVGLDRIIVHSRQLEEMKKILDENGIGYTVEIKETSYNNINIENKLKDGMGFRDDLQREYNDYLLDKKDTYLCTLQTGKGKTGSTIISLMKRNNTSRFTLLIPPKFHLIWEDAFK